MEEEEAEPPRDEARVSEFPDCTNGWRFEAWKLHKRRGWDFYRAYDHVLVRYLARGSPWPLLDLIYRLHRPPGPSAAKFTAAITDRQPLLDGLSEISDLPLTHYRSRLRHCKAKYEIRISDRRGRGAPGPDDATKTETRWRLVIGFSALAEGKAPRNAFSIDLGNALFPKRYVRWKGRPFPFKAELVRNDDVLGCPINPELETRDEVLAAAVARKLEGGLRYKAASAPTPFARRRTCAVSRAPRYIDCWRKGRSQT